MKKVSYTIPLFIVPCFIPACKTFDPQLLRPPDQLENRLPPLEVQIDQASLEAAYSLGEVRTNTQEHQMEIVKGFTVSLASAKNQAFRDKRIQHAVVIFDRELGGNICETEGKKYGYAICRIANSKTSLGWGWLLPSVLTAFIANVLGFPWYSETTELDVEIEILDARNNQVGKYSALAEDTKYEALYWGYGDGFMPQKDADNDLTRTTNAYALRSAMDDIKRQISIDAVRIRSKLLDAGELNQ